MSSSRWSTAPGSKARAIVASMSSSLDSKTRKIVPSATPAASAINRVVTFRPCSWSSGRVTVIRALPPLFRRHRPRPLPPHHVHPGEV